MREPEIVQHMTDGELVTVSDSAFYRVTAESAAGGAVSFAATSTLHEARLVAAEYRRDPNNAQYDVWYIAKFQPQVAMSIVEQLP